MSDFYDPSVADELGQGMQYGSGVELPFGVVYLRALNGKPEPSFRQSAPVRYFGGWTVGVDDLKQLAETTGKKVPGEFVQLTTSTQGGQEYDVYGTRFVYVAPIGLRKSFVDEDTKTRSPEFFYTEQGKAARVHLQVLCLLGTKPDAKVLKFEPFAPVVLTAKGVGMVPPLQEAFGDWNRATYNARRRFASKHAGDETKPAPPWIFYLKLGTFGDKRVTKTVGKTNKQDVTPLTAQIPNEITDELLEALYVGKEAMTYMLDLKRQAKDWLEAWNQPLNESRPTPQRGPARGNARPGAEPPYEDDYIPEQGGEQFDDDIPF